MRFSKKVVAICVGFLMLVSAAAFTLYYLLRVEPPQALLDRMFLFFGTELVLACIATAIGDKNDRNKEE